jgi:hypothetical protein
MEPSTATKNLAPTQDHFKYWSWIWQYALIGVLLTMINQYFTTQSVATQSVTAVTVIMSILHTGFRCIFWVGLGRAFDLKRAAMYAVYVQIGSHIADLVYLRASKPNLDNLYHMPSLVVYLCWCAPLLTFLWTAFPNRDRLTLILFGASASIIGYIWGGLGFFNFIWQEISFLTIRSSNMYVFLPDYWYAFLNTLAQTVIVAAFISHLKHFDFGFRDKLVQLDHQYSNAQALLIYWGTKIVIMGLPYGILQDAGRVMRGYGSSPHNLLQLFVFIKTLISLVTLYFVVQYFRKFMLEHLYSRGLVPSFNYWLMMIPIIGLFVFLSTLRRSQVPVSERIPLFEKSAGLNNKDVIIAFIVFLQLFMMFWSGFNTGSFISALISIGFFVFFAYNEVALQIIVGIIGLAIVYLFLGNDFNTAATLALTCTFQAAMMYALIGVFHIDSFEYLPALEADETLIES